MKGWSGTMLTSTLDSGRGGGVGVKEVNVPPFNRSVRNFKSTPEENQIPLETKRFLIG